MIAFQSTLTPVLLASAVALGTADAGVLPVAVICLLALALEIGFGLTTPRPPGA